MSLKFPAADIITIFLCVHWYYFECHPIFAKVCPLVCLVRTFKIYKQHQQYQKLKPTFAADSDSWKGVIFLLKVLFMLLLLYHSLSIGMEGLGILVLHKILSKKHSRMKSTLRDLSRCVMVQFSAQFFVRCI